MLALNDGLEAKTVFDYLQREQPGIFADGQLRTLQRRVKAWRALEGPAKQTYFAQRHELGQLCQSDFTHMSRLGITIQRQPFQHMVYHFVLTYSNWETASLCFSESFEALSAGLQAALWELGGVPVAHQTDCLKAAVHKLQHPEDFTGRYRALLNHYGLEGRKTNPSSPHENGDVEQCHHRFHRAIEQSLMLRGSCDFATQDDTRLQVRVSRFSTIRVRGKTYSVHSRFNGESVQVRLHADHLNVYYAQRHLERIPRLRGKGGHRIQYRHIIDQLVRKPGAFAHYRDRDDLFPTTRFRVAYDTLRRSHNESVGSREYLRILQTGGPGE